MHSNVELSISNDRRYFTHITFAGGVAIDEDLFADDDLDELEDELDDLDIQ